MLCGAIWLELSGARIFDIYNSLEKLKESAWKGWRERLFSFQESLIGSIPVLVLIERLYGANNRWRF